MCLRVCVDAFADVRLFLRDVLGGYLRGDSGDCYQHSLGGCVCIVFVRKRGWLPVLYDNCPEILCLV